MAGRKPQPNYDPKQPITRALFPDRVDSIVHMEKAPPIVFVKKPVKCEISLSKDSGLIGTPLNTVANRLLWFRLLRSNLTIMIVDRAPPENERMDFGRFS